MQPDTNYSTLGFLYRGESLFLASSYFLSILYLVFGNSLRRHIRIRLTEGYEDSSIIEELEKEGVAPMVAKQNLKTTKCLFRKEIARCKADVVKQAQQQSQEPVVTFVGSEGGGRDYGSDERLAFQLSCFGVGVSENG